MKQLITFFTILISSSILWAQTPEQMSYQAVIRNSANELVANSQVGMQLSILQGTPTGTAVYTETQTPTTNPNGLVSLQIGTGTTSDDFSSIDWANGPYFIKTETDPAGGSNYSITGTSQLLSVPYAMYAKTAGNTEPGPQGEAGVGITSTTDNNDGTFTLNFSDGSVFTTADLTGPQGATGSTGPQGNDGTDGEDGVGITSTTDNGDGTFTINYDDGTTFTTSDLTGPQGPQGPAGLDGNGIASTVDNGDGSFTFTYDDGSTFTTSDLTGPAGSISTYSVGDFAQGGIVFWVDETGQHGLVCAKEDQSTGVRWYAGTWGNTQAKGDGPYAGEANTSIIIAAQVAIGDDGSTYAARICNELQVTEGGKTYGDWYLPSKEELDLMYQNKATIDAPAGANGGSGFASAYYWSSTEHSTSGARDQNFANGEQSIRFKHGLNSVRAVRAF